MKKAIRIISIILFSVGVSILLYDPISSAIYKHNIDNAIIEFEKIRKNIPDDAEQEYTYIPNNKPTENTNFRANNSSETVKIDLDKLYIDSVNYNKNLINNQNNLLVDSNSYTSSALNLRDYGIYNNMYGYITIQKIDLKLPIYLGANDTTMSFGAAHLNYTSLPIGGESNNTVLAGHTGYWGKTFFDNIKYLNIGDNIQITNYWDTLSYKVIDKKQLKPEETQSIYIRDNKDILTLLTCISNGKERYYIICERCK
ncbi:MAG: class C sortase [Ruminococcus sp.]|nr:class C sortase [Ruminococcus sp.]